MKTQPDIMVTTTPVVIANSGVVVQNKGARPIYFNTSNKNYDGFVLNMGEHFRFTDITYLYAYTQFGVSILSVMDDQTIFPKFSADTLSDTDIESLYMRMMVKHKRHWDDFSVVAKDKPVTLRIADSNINLVTTFTGNTSVKYELVQRDETLPADYSVRRFTVYDTVSLEGKATPSYKFMSFSKTPFVLDDFAYSHGQENWSMNLVDVRGLVMYKVTGQMVYNPDGSNNNILFLNSEKVLSGSL